MAEPVLSDLYEEQEKNETFRDHLPSMDEEGKRLWLFPKKPKGKWFNRRKVLAYSLIAFMFAGPFLKIGGQPLLLLNVFDRKFVLFGQIFWPQDFHLFAIGLITLVVFIILFTVAFGRLFCGWVCPQTIFMEFVFRQIEYLIDGDYMAQKKLSKAPWNIGKIVKRTLKHGIFVIISLLIMHTFMAYLLGLDGLWDIIQEGPMQRPGGFTSMLVFTGLFYGVFAHFREQVCTQVCPYGRLQGVLLDKKSIVVAYDYERGEERGKFRKGEDRDSLGKGDCIDCKQCVYVCPTGIDIRNGTQLECVNCTACIDACNDIMERIDKPKGLIRYDSELGISEKQPLKFNTRIAGYSIILLILLGVLSSMMILRSDVETTILRTPGMTYQEREDGTISNLYNIKILNKTNSEIRIELKSGDPINRIERVGEIITVPASGSGQGAFFIVKDAEDVLERSSTLELQVFGNGELMETVSTKFLGPINLN